MAGIAGIVLKSTHEGTGRFELAFTAMMNKLAESESQFRRTFSEKGVFLGNVVPVSALVNDHLLQNEPLDIIVVIDGLVYVNEMDKNIVKEKYGAVQTGSDYWLLPYLYDLYDAEIVNHITGWYNIFIFNRKQSKGFIFNDQLGYLPLYFYESDGYLLFASKIECILSSGLLPALEFDHTTIAEHLFFNYPLSDHTYIKGINTLANATTITFDKQGWKKQRYWGVEKWFGNSPAKDNESIDIINDGLSQSLNKLVRQQDKLFNFSLTGGWDSRLILSYLLPEYKERLKLYSFGAEFSDDILIPQKIAVAENLDYTPYKLDQNYLDADFLPVAFKTIKLSNGTRNYKRAHYLYAIQKIAEKSDTLITGIFGDEVIKVSQITGGTVMPQNLVDFIGSDFNVGQTMNKLNQNALLKGLMKEPNSMEEFASRLEAVKNKVSSFDKLSGKYYYIRFELNLRKYFGAEVNSYNDFVYCYSPFIDIDFLNAFARTSFMGIHYPYNSNNLKLKMKSTLLYYELTKRNYKPLVGYNSARGYSMKNAATNLGKIKILINKKLKFKRTNVDGFNTRSTDTIFLNYLNNSEYRKTELPLSIQTALDNKKIADINSLVYWMNKLIT